MTKHIFLTCLAALLSAVGHAFAAQQLPATLQGNWSAVDGSQTWAYGFHPAVAVWQNTFWDYDGVTTKGAVTTILLRERAGDRTATLYARWNPKDSMAMIGLSPKNLMPYSHQIIADPSYRLPEAQDLPYPGGDSVMRNGTAVVRGYLKDYSPEAMARTIKIYGFNTITGEDMPAVGDIAADGTFEMAMELGHPITAQIVLTGGGYGNIYIEPGDTLMLCFEITRGNTSEPREWYMGTNGRVNREMSRLKELYVPFEREDQAFLMRTTPDSIRVWVDERIALDLAATAKYMAENGISRKGAFLARWTPVVLNNERLGLYAMYRERENPVDTAFYGFYRQLPLDNPAMVGVNSYQDLINRLEFCPVYWKQNFATLRFSDLKRDGFPIEAGDLPLIDTLERNLYSVPGDSAATMQAYSRAWGNLFDKYGVFFNIRSAVGDNGQTYTMGDAYWGRPMPFLNDLIAVRRLHGTYKRMDRNIPNRWLAMILSRFTTPYVIGTILDVNDALRPVQVATMAAAGPYVPADRGERLLDSLLQQHRGRAVYVDFWSTSCGPCRQGMMESYKIKEKLNGKPVDFVYITSTDQSPELAAANFVADNNITGRQIRLTPDEWNILAAKYKINGIPHYIIVGPDGRVVNPHYRGYGDEVVRDLLKIAGE